MPLKSKKSKKKVKPSELAKADDGPLKITTVRMPTHFFERVGKLNTRLRKKGRSSVHVSDIIREGAMDRLAQLIETYMK